jgi:hypothetical protein
LECGMRHQYRMKTGQCRSCYNKHHRIDTMTAQEYTDYLTLKNSTSFPTMA